MATIQRKKKKTTKLDAFNNYHLHFNSTTGVQAEADCPFCGKDNHFLVDPDTGLWDCKRCGETGNLPQFLEKVLDSYLENTGVSDYKSLRLQRGNVAHNLDYKKAKFAYHEGRWFFPHYSASGELQDLRNYLATGENKGIKGTATMHVGLWGIPDLLDRKKVNHPIIICEGELDGLAVKSMVRRNNIDAVVVAVAGANTFKKEWLPHFQNRDVILAYDADTAGDNGIIKVGYGKTGKNGVLNSIAKSIRFIRWGLDAPVGYDCSDLIKDASDIKEAWDTFNSLIDTAPRNRVSKTIAKKLESSEESKKKVKPVSFSIIVKRYKEKLKFNKDLERGLRCIFAAVMSSSIKNDPLWFYMVAPAGGGKTMLINPLKGSHRVLLQSSLTSKSLISGFQTTKDPSLLAQLDEKTLILKDFTEILSLPAFAQDEIFSTLRGAYDGSASKTYGNAVSRHYELTFSIVACVTTAIHGVNKSNLGERMLKYQLIPHGREDDQEEIIFSAMEQVGEEGKIDEALGEITCNFIEQEFNFMELKRAVPIWAKKRIGALAQLVAKLRGEVSRDFKGSLVLHRPQDEIGSRLAKQLFKLAAMLILTSKDKKFGSEEMRIVERVAFDTSIGWNLDIVQVMYKASKNGDSLTRKDIADEAKIPLSNMDVRLNDMELLGIIEKTKGEKQLRRLPSSFYSLSPRILRLWEQAGIEGDHVKRIRSASKGLRPKSRVPNHKREVVK